MKCLAAAVATAVVAAITAAAAVAATATMVADVGIAAAVVAVATDRGDEPGTRLMFASFATIEKYSGRASKEVRLFLLVDGSTGGLVLRWVVGSGMS